MKRAAFYVVKECRPRLSLSVCLRVPASMRLAVRSAYSLRTRAAYTLAVNVAYLRRVAIRAPPPPLLYIGLGLPFPGASRRVYVPLAAFNRSGGPRRLRGSPSFPPPPLTRPAGRHGQVVPLRSAAAAARRTIENQYDVDGTRLPTHSERISFCRPLDTVVAFCGGAAVWLHRTRSRKRLS